MRRHNFQTVSWFWDLYNRNLLDLDPPYQRRSVWNQEYKDYFIDTILLEYPAPAIFLYEEIDPNGISQYKVVDGKQRLTTIFDFINNSFSVYEKAEISSLQGKFFRDLDDQIKNKIWGYPFLVEYLPSNDESIINNIFNRINKNVAKLTAQELRHARFDGPFITLAEEMTVKLENELPNNFPRIGLHSKKKMKDVELIADLFLLIEKGPHGYNRSVKTTKEFLKILGAEFSNISTSEFPRSISILQLIFGILYEKKLIDLDKKDYYPNISTELETLFPDTKNIIKRFNHNE